MAAKKKAKKMVRGAAAVNTIESAVSSIFDISANTEKASVALSSERKKLAAAAKRLSKKRATLMRKKKSTAMKLKKAPDAAGKKALKAIEKDISMTRKEAAKVSGQKNVVSSELAEIKGAAKRASAYSKAIAAADKVLNKPKKKRRKKRTAKKA